MARKYYSRFLNSGVNTSASNWSTIEGYVKSYVKTLCVPTAAAGSYTDPASVISTAQTNLKTVMKTTTPLSAPLYFYVPEAIYLAPNIDSSHKSSSANFQWFIQNTVNTATAGAATTKQSYDTNGYVYFSYANLDTTQNVSLSATALNASGSVISGSSIKSLTFSDDGVYKKATITQESTSPSLTAATTGYYIRWTVKYTDAIDGYEKQAVAYTYVYKPYIQPSGTAMDSRNEAGDNHDAGNITWVSGVHSDAAGGDRYPNSVSGGNKSMVPFSSTAKSSKPLGVKGTQLYAQFPDWFGTSASNNSPNDWFNTSSSTYLPRKTFVYLKYFEGNGGFWGGTNPNSNHTWLTAPTTYLYVDTSRYSNLKYIPNLSAGLFVTSDKSSDKGAWYVADATDKEETVSQTENQRGKNNFGSARTLYYNYKKIIANEGSFDSPGDYKAEGVKYNGPVDIELMKAAGSEKVYKVKATYFNSQSTDKITNAGVMPIKVYQNDKGDLRKAVMRAQNNFPNLGITYNGSSFSSYFYSGTEFTTFCTNYERAYKELVKLDGRFYSSKTIAAIANELNSAIDNLIAGKSLKTKCTAREYNLGLEKLDNGQYKIVEIMGGEQYEITYDARDNVYFTPDTYEGYTYVGKCALTNESITPSDYYGKTLASLPTFFSASNLYSNSMSYSGSTVTIGTTTVKTTTVPKFDGDTTAYEWVAAVDDTSLTMVNFYFIDQNKIYFDPNDGSSGVNLLTQPTTYKSGNNFYSPTFTSSPGNGVTATFDQTDSTFTFNGTPTTGAEYFRFPIAGKLKANTNYTYRVVYVSGSKTLDGGTLTLTLDICDKNGNRCYKASGETYSDRFVFDQTANQATTSRTLAPDAYQAANAEFVQVFTYSPSYGTVRYNNYKVKIELVESGSANQTYSPNAIQQFYGHSIGTMPVPVRENHRFLGWFTAPDGGDRVTASSVMDSSDMTVYAHWALTDKVLLLDNDFNFDDFVRKASNNNAFDTFMNSYKACKLPGMKNPLSYQENDYFSYSIAKDTEGDTALNVKYDRKHIVDAGVDEVFDTFKSDTYTASVEGEYTLTYEYRINDYYSYIKDTTGKSEYDSIVLGFSTNDGYWYNGGQGVSYTENRKTTDGYESVELKRTFTAGTQYFFNMIFYFAYYNNYNELRADMDIKNIVLKDPNGNIVLSSNGMNTVNGTSSFDSDARTITLKPTGTDCYTNTYDNLSSYRSTLEAGKKYTLLMDYQATTATKISPFIFFYPNATSTSYTSFAAAYIRVPAGSGTVAMQFTVPSDNYYQIRFSENSVDGSTVPGTLTLGNISLQRTEIFSDGAYVADSSTYLGWVSKVTGSASATAVYVNDLNSRNEKIVSHYQDIDYGAQYDELYVPTREGFTFLGWYDADGTPYTDANGNAVGNHVCTTDGFKLYSRWTPKTFNLKYNAFRPNDSAGAVTAGTVGNLPTPNPQVLKFGVESSISLTAPTLTGYTFSGWSETYGGAKVYDKGQTLSASTVSRMYKDCNGGTYNIYTTWTANKYKIHFDKNATDANGSMADMDMVYDVAKNLNENKFSREGYTFQGWNTAKNGSGTSYDDKALVNNLTAAPNGTVTLYAQWTINPYNIKVYSKSNKYNNVTAYTKDTVGGTVQINTTPASTSTTLNYGTEYSITATEKTGYKFEGWYTPKDGNDFGTLVSTSETYTTTLGAANIEYYAKFNVRTYTITIDPNSPTTGSNISGWYDYGDHKSTPAPVQTVTKTTSVTMTYGSTVTMTAPKKTGYTFGGWKLDGNGTLNSTADITKNSTYTCGAGSGTVTAIWNINTFTIKYNGNGSNAGTSVPDQTFTYNVAQKLNKNTFEKKYTITFNGNGGTIDGKTEVTDTAVWNPNGWNNKADGTGGYSYDDMKSVTNPCGLIENGSSATLYTQWKDGNLNLKTAERTGYVFLGWALTDNAEVPTYTVNQSVNFTKNTTFFAVWVETATAQERVKSIDVVSGITIKSNDLSVEPIVKTQKKYLFLNNEEYTNICIAYEKALDNFNKSKTLDNAKKLVEAVKAVGSYQAGDFKYDAPIKNFIREFEIEYASGVTGAVGAGTHKLSDLNLNHYTKEILSENEDSILKQVKLAEAVTSISSQSIINEAVKKIAKNYANKVKVSTTPTYKVYENSEEIKNILSLSEGISGVNYVRTDDGNAVYYCYANSTNPKIYLEVEDEMTTQNRLCYPTRSEVTSRVVEPVLKPTTSDVNANFTPGTKEVNNSTYTTYINEGLGNTFTGTVNGKKFTGLSYYKQKSTVELSPVFTENKNGAAEYVLTSTDDSYNSASATLGGNYATTASLSAGKNSGKDFTGSTKKTVTIIIDYHVAEEIKDENGNPTGEFQKLDVTGDQVQMDKWLNQYHLFRQSGGASNWELPKTGDKVYKVNDTTYGQTDRGSFTFTYELGATDIGNGKINTTDVNEIIKLFKDESNYSAAKKLSFVGTKYWTKNSNGTRVQHEGSGLGYQVWGNNWSFNYYPKSQSYTYVHLVDRWGNVADKVFYVGNQDIKAISVATASTDGSYTILEDGGSGIDTLSLNAGTLEILTDENSTLENNVYRTTGNTVRIKTGEANKSYTLSMKDKATNASTATLESDGNGIITLSIDDAMYKSGVYTFMLNGTEINLYDGVNNDKYILNVYDGEAEEGEAAEMIVITTGEVGKTRFTDTDGNTVTVAASETNEDGTKTWRMSKSRPAGEYEYRISVKVGHDWIEENSTGKLIFTEKQLDTGRIVKAEYDEESGLYRLTIEGRATKIQFITEDGMTRTYTRYSEAVKSRKSYDAEGNEVPDTGRLLDHEVWLVNARLYSGQNYTVAGKFEAGWNREGTATLTAH